MAKPNHRAPIRVFLVDDHAVVRRGMRAFLDMVDDMEIHGEASDGQDAVNQLASAAARNDLPDVVLMDLQMPRLDGISATQAITAQFPSVNVIVVSSFSEGERVQMALKAGASGYLPKCADVDQVVSAIRTANCGGVHLDPVAARNVMRALTAPERSTTVLTPREREILLLVAKGHSNQDIANALMISERTARTHVSNMLTKLALSSRTQAALWAHKEGLVAHTG